MKKNRKYFEGIYFKLEQNNNVIAFIQYIDKDSSYYFKYNKNKYIRKNNTIIIDNNILSPEGLSIYLKSKDLNIKGNVVFSNLTPLKHNIMGPFQHLPMQCMHGIISMHHNVNGSLLINNNVITFNNAIGYSEEDKGTSFPTNYTWLHYASSVNNTSIMLAIADIPLGKVTFTGVICAITHNNQEYILATYKGVKIVKYTNKQIILKQGKLYLKVDIFETNGNKLLAPNNGDMTRIIKENISCKGKISFYINSIPIFEFTSDCISFEYAKEF